MAHAGRTATLPRQKLNISYVIRDEVEPDHRGGINSLCYDNISQRLYTAGRDSVIRGWDVSSLQKKNVVQLEHHSDWVNDAVVVNNGKFLLSGSSDTSLKFWNLSSGICSATLRTHNDYVRALAYGEQGNVAMSAGLDSQVFFWDIPTLLCVSVKQPTVNTRQLRGHKRSVYSVACNPSGTLVVSGGTENIIRVWDSRTFTKVCKLKGHQDNIRSLLVSPDGTQCLSGSSDGTIRLWSLGQQRCVTTVRCHEMGVWSLLTSPDKFNLVYSAGRDKCVYLTDMRSPSTSEFIARESAPITKMVLDNERRIWIATTDSSVSLWDPCAVSESESEASSRTNGQDKSDSGNEDSVASTVPLLQKPVFAITGMPAIVKTQLLKNRRHVLSLDTDRSVVLWDIFVGKKLKEFGAVNFDETLDSLQNATTIYVPNWCTISSNLGYMQVTLDECDCYAAWVWALTCGYEPQLAGTKLNLGAILLHALFEHWIEINSQRDTGNQDSTLPARGNGYYSLDKHLPVFICEAGDAGRTSFRSTVGDLKNLGERSGLSDILPQWAQDILVKGLLPKYLKIPFFLEPAKETSLRPLRKDRLSAHDVLEIQKILEHLHEFLFVSDDALMQRDQRIAGWKEKEPQEVLEVLLGNVVLDPGMDLRTVRYFFWKSGADMKIKYRLIEESPSSSETA